jgi:putative DNA methylase
MKLFSDFFTPRQLVVLATFGDWLEQLRQQVEADALAAGWADDTTPLAAGGTGAKAYAEAITVYLALAIDRCADYNSSICSWNVSGEKMSHTFTRQSISMVWDYAEANLFSSSSGNWLGAVEWIAKVVERLGFSIPGVVRQADAASERISEQPLLISTDPPYYDNIGYADLSDFFYVWLRRHLRHIYPDLFSTLLVPKLEELVALPTRFNGDKQAAREHFEQGLQQAFIQIRQQADPNYPLTIYYAFKQQETKNDQDGKRVASTGWETMLSGLIQSGFQITGTWPIRTELRSRTVAMGTNALSTSIVLVCRPRSAKATIATRREFLQALRRELPESLNLMVRHHLSPADIDQAMIGPGMSIFSRYTQVLAADGSPMSVREALTLINQVLAELRHEEDTEYDADTRWAIRWFELHGFKAADYGQAEVISKAQNTSVQGLVEAGIVEAKGGQVRLLQRYEYPRNWSPATDQRFTLWESLQYLILAFERGGEQEAARLMFDLQHRADHLQQLAYRLFDLCEEAGLNKEAVAYNQLIQSWQRLQTLRHGVQQMEAEYS